MDDVTGVSFLVVTGAVTSESCTPSLAVASCMMGVVRTGVQSTESGCKVYSVVRATGSDRSVCFGIVGKDGGEFCIK